MLDTLAKHWSNSVKQKSFLSAPAFAIAALASGCASWDGHYRGNDYQCGNTGWSGGRGDAVAGRQGRSACGADYADAVADEIYSKESAMNWDMIEGNWKQFKGHVKEKWSRLTDDRLDLIAGKRDQLSGQIQEIYGITKDRAERQVKAFEEIHKEFLPKGQA
jgi:uncharacterized protein YjbJ (UPF0337 family)